MQNCKKIQLTVDCFNDRLQSINRLLVAALTARAPAAGGCDVAAPSEQK